MNDIIPSVNYRELFLVVGVLSILAGATAVVLNWKLRREGKSKKRSRK